MKKDYRKRKVIATLIIGAEDCYCCRSLHFIENDAYCTLFVNRQGPIELKTYQHDYVIFAKRCLQCKRAEVAG